MTVRTVGPVLARGALGDAIVAAILDENPGVGVLDRGGYVRVLAPGRCRLTQEVLAVHAGPDVRLRDALERAMSSFKGRLTLTDEEARWEAE